jgi:hypothetical protein
MEGARRTDGWLGLSIGTQHSLGWGEHCDVFTLATIAGHSSITMTQRNVHPQADAIERAFARWVGTKLGTTRNGGIILCPKISRNPFSYK